MSRKVSRQPKRKKLVCVGQLDIRCEAVVSRRIYLRHDGRCEYCALEWYERVKAWRWGTADPLCEQVFSAVSGH